MSIRFALVGTGAISDRHAAAIRALGDDGELVAVVSRSADRAAEWARRHDVDAFTSVSDAVAGSSAEVVVVCTETGSHAALAIEALESGAKVIVEKPADVDVERIDRMIAAQRASGLLVAVVSQHRFDPATERVLEAVRSGRLGTVSSAVVSLALWRDQAYYDSAAWRGTRQLDGGGALMNQGIHVVDVLLALMGPAVEVIGFSAALAHSGLEVEDTAVGAIRFATGALAAVHATTGAFPGGEVRIHVHGDRGSAVILNDRLAWLGTEAASDEPDGGDALHRQYADFVDALRESRSVRVGLEDARAAVAVITGLYESARTGRAIRLSTPDL
ncbi:MAG: Gfo/Idh/MocA family oxidoreductase [Microbacterium sp.]